MTPSQYLSRPHLDNVMARQFLVGRGYEEEGLEDPDTSMLMRSREGDLRRRLRWQLARIDVLYVDVSPNDVVIDLAERRILPEAPPVQRLNTTERQRVDLDCGRDEFLALLEERTWADRIVLEEVLQHPGLVRGTAPRGAESDEELLNSFGIVLTP